MAEYSGYRIDRYIDLNPKSPTYNQTRDERVLDSECSLAQPNWEETKSYCEVDIKGAKTGYKIVSYTDINVESSTYNQTKEEKVLDETTCPAPSIDPEWIIDPNFDSYCEEIYYEPSHTLGYTGYKIVRLIDDNIFSPTANEKVITAITDSETCPAPNTDPILEEISTECEIEEDEFGNLVLNGYSKTIGLDKNVYSETYLQVTTVRQLDESCGGNTCSCDELKLGSEKVCSCEELRLPDETCICDDLVLGQEKGVLSFDELLSNMNDILSSRNRRTINSSSNAYNYLKTYYDNAELEWNNNNSPLFDIDTYQEIYNYHGNNREYETLAHNAMQAWLMAMCLTEIYADSGTTTNTQTELYKEAYNIGGGRSIDLYGDYDLHGDVTFARLAASTIYAVNRHNYTFEYLDTLRDELGGSVIEKSTSWTNLGLSFNGSVCDNTLSASLGYAVGFNDIFPSAAGPFATEFMINGGFCTPTTSPNNRIHPIDQGQSIDIFNTETKNYLVDETIDNLVTSEFNLDNNNTYYFNRAIQGLADDSTHIQHMFAERTFFKYNKNNPRGSFSAGTPTDNNGYFDGVFSSDVTGKDLSGKITNSVGTETDLAYFFGGIQYISSEYRNALLKFQYGRRRPGQGTVDMTSRRGYCSAYHPNCSVTTWFEGAQYNYLDDNSFNALIGSGTKYLENGSPVTYYIDINGNAIYDNGDIVYGAANNTATNYAPPLPATTYPSGHSAGMFGSALLLMEMLPSRWDRILKAANRFCVSRTTQRAHWNSDTLYGRQVATAIVPIIHAMKQNGTKNFRNLYENALNIVNGGGDEYPDYTDGTAGNGIAFVYHNKTGKSICFNGKINMYVKERGAENSWTTTMPSYMNKYSSDEGGWPHWYINLHTLAPNESLTVTFGEQLPDYYGNGVKVTDTTVPLTNYIGKQFVTADNAQWPSGIPAIKFAQAGYNPDTQEVHSPNGLIHVRPIAPSACDIVRGRTYHLTIDIARTEHREWNCN